MCRMTVDFSKSQSKIKGEIEIVPHGAIAKSELRIRPEAGKSLNGHRPEWLLPFFSPFKERRGETMRERNTVLLSGYAKLPTNITAEMVYEMLAVAVLFDRRSGIILEAEASMVTNIARKFIAELLVGYLNDGPDELMEDFETYYHGNAKRALETAIRMIFSKYQEYIAEQQ